MNVRRLPGRAAAAVLAVVTASLWCPRTHGLRHGLSVRQDHANPLEAVQQEQGVAIESNKAEIASLKQDIADLRARISSQPSLPTPVFTGVTGTSEEYKSGDPVLFHDVLADTGNMYQNGTVTTPRDGVYLVSLRVHAAPGNILYLNLRVNGDVMLSALSDSISPNGVTLALRLHTGDKIDVTPNSRRFVEELTLLSVVFINPPSCEEA